MNRETFEAIEQLRRERQPYIWENEANAISSQAEQAKLVAVGSLGAVAIIATGAFASGRAICLPFLEVGVAMLLIAASFGWTAYGLCAATWDARVVVRSRETTLAAASMAGEGIEAAHSEYLEAMEALHRSRNMVRLWTTVGAVIGWLSGPPLLEAVRQTQRGSCASSVIATFQAWMSAF